MVKSPPGQMPVNEGIEPSEQTKTDRSPRLNLLTRTGTFCTRKDELPVGARHAVPVLHAHAKHVARHDKQRPEQKPFALISGSTGVVRPFRGQARKRMTNSRPDCLTYRSTPSFKARSKRKLWFVRFGATFAALLFLALAARDFRAQQPPPSPAQQPAQQPAQSQPELKRPQEGQPKIAVEVKTVSVLATVRDKHGKIVSNLTKDDFQLDEDGRPQTINYFAHESDLPLRLGLLVDTSLSQRKRARSGTQRELQLSRSACCARTRIWHS